MAVGIFCVFDFLSFMCSSKFENLVEVKLSVEIFLFFYNFELSIVQFANLTTWVACIAIDTNTGIEWTIFKDVKSHSL